MPPRQRFGRRLRVLLFGAAVIGAFFFGTLWVIDTYFPADPMQQGRPILAAPKPLPQTTRTSTIVAPVAIAALAIRDVIEAHAPRDLSGKNENPLADLLGKADIGWSMARGPMTVRGSAGALAISTALNGSLRATGQLADQTGNITGTITGLIGSNFGRDIQQLTTRALDQRADIRGQVQVSARPALLPNWRIEPNLSGNVSIGDGGMTIAGIKLNIADQVKPLLDRTVSDQIGQLSARLRDDRSLESAARKQWTQMCRSIPLGQTTAGAPELWLEMRPTRAFAAQPKIVPDWTILTLGVQAETRIVPNQTKPQCPFPDNVELVPQLDQGDVRIAVPIDVPFTDLNRVLEAQLKGKTFPDSRSLRNPAPGQFTVLASSISASGDRLLISLRVKARETKSWFGFGAEATVHVWGKPVLDRQAQILRLTDITVDVESEAVFGLLGAAARAAIPLLQRALADNAMIDLKPFAANARKSIETAIADFRKPADGVEIEAEVKDLRLAGIEFDSKTLRVTAEADGMARALVRKIALQ